MTWLISGRIAWSKLMFSCSLTASTWYSNSSPSPSDPENLVRTKNILAKRRREFADAFGLAELAHYVVRPSTSYCRVDDIEPAPHSRVQSRFGSIARCPHAVGLETGAAMGTAGLLERDKRAVRAMARFYRLWVKYPPVANTNPYARRVCRRFRNRRARDSLPELRRWSHGSRRLMGIPIHSRRRYLSAADGRLVEGLFRTQDELYDGDVGLLELPAYQTSGH